MYTSGIAPTTNQGPTHQAVSPSVAVRARNFLGSSWLYGTFDRLGNRV